MGHHRIGVLRIMTTKEVPYPTSPYMAVAVATFPSGFKRDLVAYGAPCTEIVGSNAILPGYECGNPKTYLDGGSPHCRLHMVQYCRHGRGPGCCRDLEPTGIVAVRSLPVPRPARPMERH